MEIHTLHSALMRDAPAMEGIETLTHAGEQRRHMSCVSRDSAVCRPTCAYCRDAGTLTPATLIALSPYLHLSIPVCVDCGRYIRDSIEQGDWTVNITPDDLR